MKFIDTHCHLFLNEFENDLDQVVQQSIETGVYQMINPNVDDKTLPLLLTLKEKYPDNIKIALGLHPCSVKPDFKNKLYNIYNYIHKQSIIGIGEIGIDLYWDDAYKKQQIEVFETQLNWSIELNLPVIIHTRNSFDLAFSIVGQISKVRGVFHAFTGNTEQAKKIIDKGFYLGIGGITTFKNSGLAEVIQYIPTENILIETDSPYLAPVPYRGKRNIPAYIFYIASKIAELKKISLEKVAQITTQNAKSLFSM